MTSSSSISTYLEALFHSRRLENQVVFRTLLPASPPAWSPTEYDGPAQIRKALNAQGIGRLYRHQSEAIGLIEKGRHVIVATPTSSGKTLVYNLPVLQRVAADRNSKSLYIFPLKALAQDQLRAFEQLAGHFKPQPPAAAIYDGDTSAYRRRCIRDAPPAVILTNPEMLHLSFLAHHRKWADFFAGLQTVVVDEVHTYRGVTGSHVAQLFWRLHRICRHYGAAPTFIFSSATVANPAQLAEQLTGLTVKAVTRTGAPRGNRHLVFINPKTGPAQAAIVLLKAALHRELRTIVYTRSRRLTELIALWAAEKSGKFAGRISAYRAGFLPAERRDIEARLLNGDLLAVITTSALELGIDIGNLDLCLLVGYPGSVVSTWQRGGRVGRSGQDSALILIAGEDALDQFLMRNPQDFIHRQPEAAVVNPANSAIMAQHLPCAAAELPLQSDEPLLKLENVPQTLKQLEAEGHLWRSADGQQIFPRRKAPHRLVNIRGSGQRLQIVSSQTGEHLGEIDEFRSFRETHPGAVYLHRGQTFVVDALDLAARTITVTRAEVDYYTRVRGYKETEILTVAAQRTVWGATVSTGKLKVTDQVTGYETLRIRSGKLINRISLELPAHIFETEGMWFQLPAAIYRRTEAARLDYMGGIHAIEHAAIGIFPLLVLADRNDLGGIATVYHPQVKASAVFLYDGIAGGAGLTRQAFEQAQRLLKYTLGVIDSCPCETGCPSCVHSPKCGSGNRPIDKAAALYILKLLKNSNPPQKIHPAAQPPWQPKRQPATALKKSSAPLYYGVFDLETQRSAAEVGGWHRADLMKISCAVLYDSRKRRFMDFTENQVPDFIRRLQGYDRIIGFNTLRFDYQVLKGYSNFNFQKLNNLDILQEIKKFLGFRLSLAHLAEVTLGERKTADGLQALRWWQQGRILEIIEYCRQDVRITRDLYRYGRRHGHLLFRNRDGQVLRIPVDW